MANGTNLAKEYADYYHLQAQKDKETDEDFRARIATDLRRLGHVIEAQEAFYNERYENSDNVMTGLAGMMAQALDGTDITKGSKFSRGGYGAFDDDYAFGVLATDDTPKPSADELMLMIALFGKI